MNPDPCKVLRDGDRLVLLAKEQDMKLFQLGADSEPTCPTVRKRRSVQSKGENLLVLGWRGGMGDILSQMDTPWRRGGRVVVMDSRTMIERRKSLCEETGRESPPYQYVQVTNIVGNPESFTDLESAVRAHRPASVLILMKDRQGTAWGESSVGDSTMLPVLTMLQRICEVNRLDCPRVVVEVTDPGMEPLLARANTNAETISRQGVFSKLIAHATENVLVARIWDVLLSQDKENVVFESVSSLVDVAEVPVISFESMSALCYARRCTLLGFLSHDGTLVLNPPKGIPIDVRKITSLVMLSG
mmetsp:Transcript_16344/g.33272  ORF Transcript_16344/g.33272 Transcript_16344/m.33272 type:complete len:302 (-) Transcript_16344:1175-2080(-)